MLRQQMHHYGNAGKMCETRGDLGGLIPRGKLALLINTQEALLFLSFTQLSRVLAEDRHCKAVNTCLWDTSP